MQRDAAVELSDITTSVPDDHRQASGEDAEAEETARGAQDGNALLPGGTDRATVQRRQRMKRWERWFAGTIVAIGALVLFVALVRSGSHSTGAEAGNADSEMDALFASYFQSEVDAAPELATYYDLPEVEGVVSRRSRWSDLSPAGLAKVQARRQDQLARARALYAALGAMSDAQEAALSWDDRQRRVSARVMLYRLELDVELQSFRPHLMPITQLGGLQLDLPSLVGMERFVRAGDYEAYLERLRALPLLFNQTMALMATGAREGVTPPRVILDPVADQIRAQIVSDPTTSPFFAPFAQFPDGVSAAQRAQLAAQGLALVRDVVVPCYQRLLDYWTAEYLPNCRATIAATDLPNGAGFYALKVQEQTTTTLSAADVHQVGLSEVARIRGEMETLMRSLNFTGNMTSFMGQLRSNPAYYFGTEAALLTHVRDLCKRADAELPKLFKTLPRCPYGVRAVPLAQAPAAPAAYYYEPASGCTRAGFYYVNTFDLPSRPSYVMESTTLHETVPGHHLQIALAQELEGLPDLRRFAGWTAYIEGWALYAESLGPSMGFYTDPYVRFGAYGDEILRACRLVVDTGMHALQWSRDAAVSYMLENTPLSELDVRAEVDRYLAIPAQALAYTTGALRIQGLRNSTAAALGDRFDLRDFHAAVLGAGALPLDELGRQVAAVMLHASRQ